MSSNGKPKSSKPTSVRGNFPDRSVSSGQETLAASPSDNIVTWQDWLLVLMIAIGLTAVFWWPLWNGGGLIGGDIYSYFFPQKQFFAESIRAGEIPFWNNRTSFGYPLIAESQTGAFYPPHLVLYPLLDVNTAYNACQLLHYVAAFVFCWRLGRELRLTFGGSLLSALVYTYGWFPPRMCLEWAILGGVWLPLAVLFVERFLNESRWRWLAALSLTLAVQMLAGHYNLAFITQLLVVVYAGLRLLHWCCVIRGWMAVDRSEPSVRAAGGSPDSNVSHPPSNSTWRAAAKVALSLVLALGIAAPQLLPTWELKQASQREQIDGREFDPGHGHIPPLYLSQVVASWWFWYSPDVNRDQALRQLDWLAISSDTNQTEAHLYFGLPPVLVLAVCLLQWRLRSQLLTRQTLLWLLISLGAVIYATGWLLPVTQHLPGFGFFRGPGRYGIIATLGIAIVVGRALSLLVSGMSIRIRFGVVATVFALTTIDLLYVSRVTAVSVMLPHPVIQNLERSPIRRILNESPTLARLYGPGPNLPNLLGVSSVPEYLGIGPAEYYDPELRAPKLEDATVTAEFLDWARDSGMTHILTFDALRFGEGLPSHIDPAFSGYLRLVHEDGDPFLNPVWARPVDQPLFLYRIISSDGRAAFLNRPERQSGPTIEFKKYSANSVEFSIDSPIAKPVTLVLRDLQYPGWTATLDGEPVESLTINGQFRGVEIPNGQHVVRWTFRPTWLLTGTLISGVCLLLLGWPLFWLRLPVTASIAPETALNVPV